MAGNNSNFPPAKFRDAITQAMTMGLPPDPADRATFRFKRERTYARPDPKGMPYNLRQAPLTDNQTPDVQVPVAVAIPTRSTISMVDTPSGEINDDVRVVITVLDTYYPQVKDATEVLLGGNTYKIDYWGPPVGLFSVEVFQVFLTSLDES